MYPILFDISGFTLRTQTLLTAFAFMAGLWLAAHEGERFELQHDILVKIALWAFLGAIPGARLFFLFVFQGSTEVLSLKGLCSLWALERAFSFHGGLLGGALCGLGAALYYKMPLLRLADAFAPGLALAMFFMRLGCLMNGCDFGAPTDLPWGIHLHGMLRHPVQLYEGVVSLIGILPMLLICNRKALRAGQTFWLYLCVSSLLRVGVDFYRDEAIAGKLLRAEWVAASLFLASGVIIFLTFFMRRRDLRG